jgi:hypothetical protein
VGEQPLNNLSRPREAPYQYSLMSKFHIHHLSQSCRTRKPSPQRNASRVHIPETFQGSSPPVKTTHVSPVPFTSIPHPVPAKSPSVRGPPNQTARSPNILHLDKTSDTQPTRIHDRQPLVSRSTPLASEYESQSRHAMRRHEKRGRGRASVRLVRYRNACL